VNEAMTTLYTIGYEGLAVEELVALLAAHGVTRVLDVRKLPLSRRRGFSKTALRQALDEANIAYTHIAALGTPKELRDAVKKTHDYAAFFAAMHQQIAAQPEALTQALALIRAQPCALLCVEAAPEQCHRVTVAEQLNRYAGGMLAVEHIVR
jgi:uncharacterized protein (DUF488 family)